MFVVLFLVLLRGYAEATSSNVLAPVKTLVSENSTAFEDIDVSPNPDADLSPDVGAKLSEPEDPAVDDIFVELGEQWTPPSSNDLQRLEKDKNDYFSSTKEMMETFAGTKGDPKLTAYIIKKLQELRSKVHAESAVIRARLKRKYNNKIKHVALKKTQDKKTTAAIAAYSVEVYESRYETAQVNRQCRAYDRIMGLLNSMADWTKCKSRWTKIGSSCYRVAARGYAYLAEGKCLAMGGSLVRIDSADDKAALTKLGSRYKSGYTDTHLIVGFFRSLKTGKWEYLDGTAVNPASWYPWVKGNYNSRFYNYAGYYGGSKRVYAAVWNWGWGALCEHRLKTWGNK